MSGKALSIAALISNLSLMFPPNSISFEYRSHCRYFHLAVATPHGHKRGPKDAWDLCQGLSPTFWCCHSLCRAMSTPSSTMRQQLNNWIWGDWCLLHPGGSSEGSTRPNSPITPHQYKGYSMSSSWVISGGWLNSSVSQLPYPHIRAIEHLPHKIVAKVIWDEACKSAQTWSGT